MGHLHTHRHAGLASLWNRRAYKREESTARLDVPHVRWRVNPALWDAGGLRAGLGPYPREKHKQAACFQTRCFSTPPELDSHLGLTGHPKLVYYNIV